MFLSSVRYVLFFSLIFRRHLAKGSDESSSSSSNQQTGPPPSKSRWLSPLNPRMKPADFAKLGTRYLNQEKYDLALEMFNKAITAQTAFAEYHKLRGDCLLQMGFVDKAIQDLREVARKDPKRENRSYLIEVLLNHAKHTEALAETRDFDQNGVELAKLGQHFFKKNLFDEAITCFSEAIAKVGTEASYFRERGNCYWEKRDFNKAIENYEKALSLSPNYPDVKIRLCKLLYNVGRYREAVNLAFDLPYSELLGLANDLFRKDQFEEASRCYDDLIAKNPRNPTFFKDRGFCYRKTGRLNSAISDFQTLVEIMPNNIPRKLDLCEVLLDARRVEECEEVLKEINERNVAIIDKPRLSKIYEDIQAVRETKIREKREKLLNFSRGLIISDTARKAQRIRDDTSLRGRDNFQEGQKRIRELESTCEELLRKLERAFDKYNSGVPLVARRRTPTTLPSFLQDGISLDLIVDPYTTPGGHTYGREVILEVIQTTGKDPLTREPLTEAMLRPNFAVKEAISVRKEEGELDNATDDVAGPSTS